jgi:hypothetical protein
MGRQLVGALWSLRRCLGRRAGALPLSQSCAVNASWTVGGTAGQCQLALACRRGWGWGASHLNLQKHLLPAELLCGRLPHAPHAAAAAAAGWGGATCEDPYEMVSRRPGRQAGLSF